MKNKEQVALSPVLVESLEHGARVASYAKEIFLALSDLHKLPKKWLRILHLGAQLHDIGWLQGKQGHHKLSASMIRAGKIHDTQDLPIAVPQDIRHLVALVARYHRRAEPHIRQKRFAALQEKERQAMLYLAAIIRLADALDYSHTGSVHHIRVQRTPTHVLLELTCHQDCHSEISRVAVKKELFCKVFQQDVLCNHTVLQ